MGFRDDALSSRFCMKQWTYSILYDFFNGPKLYAYVLELHKLKYST